MPEGTDAAAVDATIRRHRRRDAVTAVVGAWLTGGLFLDGWAHNNLPSLETFFTPWHALFYSGFAACAAWILYVALRDRAPGRSWRETVPPGYGLSLVGIIVFAVSGAGDLTWHTIFGIERGIAALLSPTHLGLITGALLVVTTPFRAAVADGLIPRSGGWRQLGPVVASVSLAGLLLAFIFQNVAQFSQNQFVSLGVGQYIGGVAGVPDLANWHTDALVFALPHRFAVSLRPMADVGTQLPASAIQPAADDHHPGDPAAGHPRIRRPGIDRRGGDLGSGRRTARLPRGAGAG